MADWFNGIGVTLILVSFILLTLRKISSESLFYKTLNFLGAGMACIGAWMLGVWAFVLLEGVWSLVALYSIIKR